MSTQYETGHAKNVANFLDIIAFVIGYGATYNPSKAALKLANLQAKAATEQNNINTVIAKNTAYNNAVNTRAIEFSNVKQLSTRIVSALTTTDAPTQKLNDAKGFNRKIQGRRASPLHPSATTPATDPNTPAPKTINAAQLSYDQILQHLNGLISVAQSEPTYTPNENDLKIATLTTKAAAMLAKTNAVATEYTNISNARIARNKGLYADKTGLVDIANEVKEHVKSIYGYTSPEYKQISKIKFTKPK